MRSACSLSAGVVLACVGALAAPAAAQDSTTVIQLETTYSTRDLSGFVVLPFGGGGEVAAAAAAAGEIVRRDLDFSDRFQVRDAGGASAAGPVNLALWRERGADWVLQGVATPRAGGITLRLTLHDAIYNQVKGEASFDLPMPGDRRFRMAAHAAADAVVRWATGEPGMAASRIAFVMPGRGSKEIYVVDSDGENLGRVTSDGSIALSPAWSPDGTRIAYASYKGGPLVLYERTLSTGQDRAVSNRDGLNITPAYSPDGRTIAFATTVGGATELATVSSGGGGLQQQTRSRRAASLSPSFAPDGGRVAFVSDRLGEPQIYVMELGGGEPRLISEYTYGRRGYAASPDWSPTGPRIAYHARVNGGFQLVMVGADGGSGRLLTNSGRNEDPSWAPDGRHLVFSSDRDGGGLFVLDTVTGRVRQIVRARGAGLPDWSGALARAGDAR